jgi:hypothetical protein|tara:strand:- start:98 stop:1039 length:942 start_codon:yes stop_codon:yes gene_type:complete
MANTTSGSYDFDKNLSIDEIIEDAYERIGIQGVSGYQLKTAKRSLNILFSEWGNRGLHFWEVVNQNVTLVSGQAVYNFYRAPTDGVSDGMATTITAAMTTGQVTVPCTSVTGFPTFGTVLIGTEQISYTGISSLNLTGCVRGINGTTAATHADGDALTQTPRGMDNIQEANYRVASTSVDTPMTRISRSQYQAFSNKTDLGLCTQYWVQRFIDKVTMTLYLTPGSSQAGDFINFYYTKRIDNVGAYTNATDVPYRFIPCMIAGLAFYLSTKYAPQREQGLKMLYEDELARAESEDGNTTNSTYISPKIYNPGL